MTKDTSNTVDLNVNNYTVLPSEDLAQQSGTFSLVDILGDENTLFNTDLGAYVQNNFKQGDVGTMVKGNETSVKVAGMLRKVIAKNNVKETVKNINAEIEANPELDYNDYLFLLASRLTSISTKKALKLINTLEKDLSTGGDWITPFSTSVITINNLKLAFKDVIEQIVFSDVNVDENNKDVMQEGIRNLVETAVESLSDDFEEMVKLLNEFDIKGVREVSNEVQVNLTKFVEVNSELIDGITGESENPVASENPLPIQPIPTLPKTEESVQALLGSIDEGYTKRLGVPIYKMVGGTAGEVIDETGDWYIPSSYNGELVYMGTK